MNYRSQIARLDADLGQFLEDSRYHVGDDVIERHGDGEIAAVTRPATVIREIVVESGPHEGRRLVVTSTGNCYDQLTGMGRDITGGSPSFYRSIREPGVRDPISRGGAE